MRTEKTNKENKELVCTDCGKELSPDDYLKKWGYCRYCNQPVCFDCARYVGVRVRGLYHDYIEAVRVCRKCYPKKPR
ncbi:MAG: hypothetical protein QXF09_03650 [Nitrososphaerota archaeon]